MGKMLIIIIIIIIIITVLNFNLEDLNWEFLKKAQNIEILYSIKGSTKRSYFNQNTQFFKCFFSKFKKS